MPGAQGGGGQCRRCGGIRGNVLVLWGLLSVVNSGRFRYGGGAALGCNLVGVSAVLADSGCVGVGGGKALA